MNQISTARRSTPVAKISENLAMALHLAETDGLRYGVKRDVADEAGRLLAQESAMPHASPDVVLDWLKVIVPGVSNPPTTDAELRLRAVAIAGACDDLPAALFTSDAARAGLKRWKFFPSGTEVRDLIGAEHLAKRRNLIAVAKACPTAPVSGPRTRTEEEIAHVVEAATGYREEVKAHREAAEPGRPAIRASYLSGEALAQARREAKIKIGGQA